MEESWKIPRRYLPTVNEGFKLIGFCDASIKAYAAVIYLQDHNQDCSLVASKMRVASAQAQSIPRLELLGAILLSRLSKYSSIVLHWIRETDKNWKPFVRHHIMEIREKIREKCWNHCRGEDNPADLPSHGILKNGVTEYCTGPEGRDGKQSPVVSEELRSRAELLWIQETQHGRIKKEWMPQFRLHVFLDNQGVWSCKGRLENAELSYNTCYPIVLPLVELFTNSD
uniref:Uncharacterized protein n=1 Tax=Amphimedon queenslandica TaxID=400682 RepID=A0A1X7TZ72_AMPQE